MMPPSTSPSARVRIPSLPKAPERAPFPLIATLAPVVMSVILWAVTQSAFALIFAVLGPGIAVASRFDARRAARRRVRVEGERFFAEIAAARTEIAEAHDRERGALAERAPSAAELVRGPAHVRWGGSPSPWLRLGRGDLPSDLGLDGGVDSRADDEMGAALRSLSRDCRTLRAAPVIVGSGKGIGIAGPPVLAQAVARALVVQLLAARSPATHAVTARGDWLRGIPHRLGEPSGPDARGGAVVVGTATETITIAVAREPAALPLGIDTVIELDGPRARIDGRDFDPELLSAEEAQAWVEAAASIARRNNLVASANLLPVSAGFGDLGPALGEGGPATLACAIGLGDAGPVVADLVRDGPHAVVGGTTGSGKSELLTSWLLSMARAYSPAQLAILLFDYKGGSSFGALPTLPHCVGLVTDLDAGGASRAVASLAAELRHRERVLAAASARSVDEAADLPRLVIVVDEFAAMAAGLPMLHEQFADIAARGRSLGVHLVLCTQRPAGVVRDAVLANASLRISLRVNNRADSIAVIGSDEAASDAASPPGRAWLARPGSAVTAMQAALVSPEDIAAIVASWGSGWSPRRPWLDPLPSVLPAANHPGSIGVVDLPEEQAQRPVRWSPRDDGSLLVVGGTRSGKSNLLQVIGTGLVAPGIEAAWDALLDPAPVLLLDDVDLLFAQCGPDHQQAFVDLLSGALRSSSTRLVMTAQRLGSSLQQVAALCDSRILLRMPSRQEHVIAGGSTADFDPGLCAGAGRWRDSRLQLLLAEGREAAALPARSIPLPPAPLLAVSRRPGVLAPLLASTGRMAVAPGGDDPPESQDVLLADPDGWQADMARYAVLAKQRPVLFHECSVAEFRQLARVRALPPPLADPATSGWLLDPTGELRRVRL